MFKIVRRTIGGKVILERDSAVPATRLSLYHGKTRAGVVLETIGRVEKPLYVAQVEPALAKVGIVFDEKER